MSHLSISHEHLAISSDLDIKIYEIATGEQSFSYSHNFDKEVKDGKNNKVNTRVEELAFTPDGRYMCALFSDKRLILLDSKIHWKVSEIHVRRRSTAFSFDSTGRWMLVADKSGDLYKYDREKEHDESEGCEPVLAHVSMLLDVAVTNNGRYIVTADRDEKIRVSLFERPYVIESFCLGHSDFVCSLLNAPDPDNSTKGQNFISGSGDGTIRLWDPENGVELCKYEFINSSHSLIESCSGNNCVNSFIPSLITSSPTENLFAVASSQPNRNTVLVFILNQNNTTFKFVYEKSIEHYVKLQDMNFAMHSDTLYVLGSKVDDNSTLFLTACECNKSDFKILCYSTISTINKSICSLVGECKDLHELLFKARCDRAVYATYQENKQVRVAERTKFEKDIHELDCKRTKCDPDKIVS